MKIFKFKAFFCSVFLAVFFAACGNGERHHMTLNEEKGFDTIYDAGQKALKISGVSEPFVLFFFSTGCGACDGQVPVMNDILSKFDGRVKVYGVMSDSNGFDSDIFTLQSKGVEFPTTSTPKSVSYFANVVGGVMGVPVSFIYDQNGKMIKQFLGLYPLSAFEAEINKILS